MKKSFFFALFIAVIASIWIVSGVISNNVAEDTVQKTPPEQEELSKINTPSVQVRDLQAEILKDTVSVTGRSQAARRVSVAAETSGQITKLYVKKGDSVKKGDIIAKLDVKDRAVRVTEAEQLIKQRRIQFDAAKRLSDQGFTSSVRLAEMQAQLETAKAQLKQARVELSKTVIQAPFSGVINDKMVEIGDYVTSGTSLVTIIDLNPIEITGFLTEKQLIKIEEGTSANISFLDGRSTIGELTFIAPAADPQTRTFAFEVTAPNEDMKFKEGLTAKVSIPTKQVQAYRISPSILSLADDGTVGVKIVNKENIVRFVPITLLKDTKEFLWVGGLPSAIRLITVGQEFVVAGQTVKPILEGSITP